MPPQDPSAEEVYQSTLDGLYDGEEGGSTESPAGWFAIVRWPGNGRWYIVSQDDQGFTYLSDEGTDELTARAVFGRLQEEYGRWEDGYGESYGESHYAGHGAGDKGDRQWTHGRQRT